MAAVSSVLTGEQQRLRLATVALFYLQPLAFGSWLPRIPEVQHALELEPAGLALALLGLPCGTLITLPFAGRLVEKLGPRRTISIGFLLYALAVGLPALAVGQPMLFGCLLLVGSAISFLELGLNVFAATVEKRTGSLIMSTSHGFWSLGIMTGSLIGTGMAAAGIEPRWAIPILSATGLMVALGVLAMLPEVATMPEPKSTAGHPIRGRFAKPLLGVCFFVLGVTMTEGAVADWSAVFMREVLSASPGTAGLSYSIFAAAVAAGRFRGDRLKAKFGASALARVVGVLALIGVTIVVLAPGTAVAFAGFAVIGLGVSVGFPLAVSSAADIPGRSPSANVAILSIVALTGFLVGPPLIGFVAQRAEMRFGLVSLLPFLALSLILARQVAQR